ncbi:MAG TPA: sigma-70 family RNA polymerase sigma factor [Planctomycetota bacterium]|nr:sigma-70 family RNA polymerase sigma factor [Planctomycetota bacterium]
MGLHEDFLKVFLRHQDGIRAFLSSVVRDRAAAEDVFQEVSLSLWESFESYDSARPFGAWARGVALKKVLQGREKARRIPLAFSPPTIQAVLDAYDRTEAAAPDTEGLRDCISKLPPRSQSLLALRYERSLKLGEIAKEVGSTLDAVHKLLSRIRENLQECLQRRLEAGPR